MAASTWGPFGTVLLFQVNSYAPAGTAGASAPTLTPSSLNCTPATPTSSVALTVKVIVPLTSASGAGLVTVTVGGVASFATVTVTLAVCGLPAASRAVAASTCGPFDAVTLFQVNPYGATVCSAPRLMTPSSVNCTPTTPTSSDAVAVIVTAPVTMAFGDGLVSVTVGAVVSGGGGGGGGGIVAVVCVRSDS